MQIAVCASCDLICINAERGFRRVSGVQELPVGLAIGYYLDPLPEWLAEDVRAYVTHIRRRWSPEGQRRATIDLLSHGTLFLRWAARNADLNDIGDLTPNLWFDYLDTRLAEGIKPVTLNGHLSGLHGLLHFLAEQDRPVCQRMLRVQSLTVLSHNLCENMSPNLCGNQAGRECG